MNKVFKLKHKSGPHGDACSTYDIIFLKENVKLYEFLEDLDPNEWGTIHLKVLNPMIAKLDYATEDEIDAASIELLELCSDDAEKQNCLNYMKKYNIEIKK